MDFRLTDDQQMIRDSVRDFSQNEIVPRAAEIDKTGEFPLDIIKKMSGLGLMGLPIAEEYGGAGADYTSYCLALEEISRACGSTGLTYEAHISLGCMPIYYFGTEEQKRKYLPQLCSGEAIGSFGLTEPEAGSDAGGTKTTAVLDNGEWVINGSKIFITNASYAKFVTCTCLTDKGQGTRGISAIIVPTDSKGFTCRAGFEKLGLHGSNTTELFFDNVRVPEENLVGKRGEGFKQFLKVLDGGRIAIGAMGVGIAQACLDAALKYAKERVQFGQPIGKFQAVQFKLADIAMNVELAQAHVPEGGVAQGHRPALRAGGQLRKAVRLGDLHQGSARGHPDPRRLRLHQGVPGGALPARRQTARDRRGHVGSHQTGHRAESRPVGGSPAARRAIERERPRGIADPAGPLCHWARFAAAPSRARRRARLRRGRRPMPPAIQ